MRKTETERQRQRQRQRETERQRDGERDRERKTETKTGRATERETERDRGERRRKETNMLTGLSAHPPVLLIPHSKQAIFCKCTYAVWQFIPLVSKQNTDLVVC